MKRKNESGVVVVESAIVITIVVMFIAVILYIGMVLYQQSVVNIMANQTAANIAQIYGNSLRDPFTGYIDVDSIQETVTYSNMRNQAYLDVIEQKADAAALYRLKSSRILNTGESDVQVEIVPKKNELLKDQIVVTIRDNYDVPLVSFFGVDNTFLSFTGTGRADCTDLLEYLTGIPALGNDDGNAPAFTNECQVNFYKHYGDSRPFVSMTVLKGRSVNDSTRYYPDSIMPVNPEQDNMKFIKWVTKDGAQFTGETVVNGELDVYGYWSCGITFDPDGGTIKPESFKNPATAVVGQQLDLPVAERAGCTFAGWYTEKNGKGKPFNGNSDEINGDMTVYAKWVCTVILDPYGGTVSASGFDVVCGQSLADAGYTLPDANRDGCTFAGWFTDYCGEGTQYSNTTKITSHTTLRAKYVCTVTLNANGGTVEGKSVVEIKDVVVGKTLNIPVADRNPGGTGWRFANWNSDIGGNGSSYSNKIEGVNNTNMVLYAQWNCVHKTTSGASRLQENWSKRHQVFCRDVNGARESYAIYECQDCRNYEEKVTIENKHYIDPDYLIENHELIVTSDSKNDFYGRCNVNHLSKATTGTSGGYDSGFSTGVGISKIYHITCVYCGMHLPKVWWDNIRPEYQVNKKLDYIYYTSYNNCPETQCRTPEWRRN